MVRWRPGAADFVFWFSRGLGLFQPRLVDVGPLETERPMRICALILSLMRDEVSPPLTLIFRWVCNKIKECGGLLIALKVHRLTSCCYWQILVTSFLLPIRSTFGGLGDENQTFTWRSVEMAVPLGLTPALDIYFLLRGQEAIFSEICDLFTWKHFREESFF